MSYRVLGFIPLILGVLLISACPSSSRVEAEFETDFTELVMNEDESLYADSTLKNSHNQDKNLTIYLEGLNPSFLDGSDRRDEYTFPANSNRTYTIRVGADNVTRDNLTVKAENNDLNLNTTEKIPVVVLPSRTEFNQVPGISFLQFLFLACLATVLYSVRL